MTASIWHDEQGLYVNLFIASELNWEEKGFKLRQETKFPHQPGTALVVTAARPEHTVWTLVPHTHLTFRFGKETPRLWRIQAVWATSEQYARNRLFDAISGNDSENRRFGRGLEGRLIRRITATARTADCWESFVAIHFVPS